MKLYLLVEGIRGHWPDEPYRVIEMFRTREQAFRFKDQAGEIDPARAAKMWCQTWSPADSDYILTPAYLTICGQPGRCMPEDVE